jgi:hypothetical protein
LPPVFKRAAATLNSSLYQSSSVPV